MLPLKPEMITTDTAFGYFSESTTRLAGVCQIKYGVDADEQKRMPRTNKLQYLATPLVLGTTDVFSAHPYLRERVLYETIDLDTDSTQTVGPWLLDPNDPAT